MTKKSKSSPKNSQGKRTAKKRQELLADKKAKQATLKADYERKRKALDAEYARKLAALNKVGAYQPKSFEITRYRKTRINKAFPWFQDLIEGKWLFVPTGKRGQQIIDRAANTLSLPTTKKGFFYPKSETTKKIKLRRGKEPAIEVTKRVEDESGWKETVERVPLEPLDAIDKQKDRWRKEADKFGKLTGNERIAFMVTEKDHEGFSRKIFRTIEDMVRYMENYKHHFADRVKFYRHITIVKTDRNVWFKEHPKDKRRRDKRRKKK